MKYIKKTRRKRRKKTRRKRRKKTRKKRSRKTRIRKKKTRKRKGGNGDESGIEMTEKNKEYTQNKSGNEPTFLWYQKANQWFKNMGPLTLNPKKKDDAMWAKKDKEVEESLRRRLQ